MPLAFEEYCYNLNFMDSEKHIEIADWTTPLLRKEIFILSAGYSKNNEFGLGVKQEKHYLIENPHFQNPACTELLVRVFCLDSEEVYKIQFYDVGGFRILDEHGLQEIIETGQNIDWPTFPTFRVRHHGWSNESSLSFCMGTNDGWSYMIMTGWDCVEVLTSSEPKVTLESKVECHKGALSNSVLDG